MTEKFHPGPHPDADQLSTFLEGATGQSERERMLAHLAQCAACREMVFLAQAPDATPVALSVERPEGWTWRRWLMPMSLAGAALACGLIAVVVLRPHPTPGGKQDQVAVERPPAPLSGAIPAQSPGLEDKKTTAQPPEKEVSKAAPLRSAGEKVAARGAGQRDPRGVIGGLFASSPAPQSQQEDSENPSPASSLAASENQLSAAAAPAGPSAPIAQSSVEPQPADSTRGRPLSPAAALSMNRLATPPALPSLHIEHQQGPSDGSSQVSGVVTDATGAVVTGANVTLRNQPGAATRQVTTDADGRFTVSELPAGHYELRVVAHGFQSASEYIDLQPSDLALLHSVLQIGSASQTVTVEAGNSAIETKQSQVNAEIVDASTNLPSSLPAVTTVTSGNRMLSVDASGTLFFSRNTGKTWKKIKPQWHGKVMQLALVPQQAQRDLQKHKGSVSRSADTVTLFQLTAESGAVWVSADGTHWRAR